MTDIKQALNQAINLLATTSPTAQLDAEVLLAHVLNASRTYLYTYPEKQLDDCQQELYNQWVIQRSEGHPMAYLTGHREFWSLSLNVAEGTLIPRPETELLVELALRLLKDVSPATLIDLGTGSGAIAIALASERPDWSIIAADLNPLAVDITQLNATALGLSNVQPCVSNWFSSIQVPQFHAIVSNPPYIPKNDPHLTQGDLRFEPQEALVSGMDGLESLTYLIKTSYDRLLPGGLLLLEHGFDQGPAVATLLNEQGYEHAQCWQDLQGHDRVSGGFRKIN